MPAPPGNLGPVSIPQGNPGNVMQAAQKLQLAHKLILEALPGLPLGTGLHTSVMKVAGDLGKHLQKAEEDVRMTVQTLMQALRQHRTDNQNAVLGRMAGVPGPNAPPAMLPPTLTPPGLSGMGGPPPPPIPAGPGGPA
jgi:hypothetical protein